MSGAVPTLTSAEKEPSKIVSTLRQVVEKLNGLAPTVETALQPSVQADQETATSNIVGVTPGTQQFHPSAAKCWGTTTGGATPVLAASYNVASISHVATGRLSVTMTTPMSSANYAVITTVQSTSTANTPRATMISAKVAGSFEIDTFNNDFVTMSDPAVGVSWVAFGDF